MKNIDKIIDLLNNSYSPFHVVNEIKNVLKEHDFVDFSHHIDENIGENTKDFYLTRNGSSIIAVKIPNKKADHFQITAAHTDSPTFKVKPNPLKKSGNLMQLNVEPYGGMLCAPWMDRPLSIAGRVSVKNGDSITSELLNIDKDLCIIPNVAIHMNRDANKDSSFDTAIDMIPFFGIASNEFNFNEFLRNFASINGEILGHDLFLYNRDKARVFGLNDEFLSSPKIDDLASTYSSLLGFVNSSNNNAISVYCAFDNEEVGSLTKQGADSDFLYVVLKEICDKIGLNYREAIAKSFMLSIDNGHANHPNHPEKSDSTTCVQLNDGIVIKYSARQSYTSDGFTASVVKEICKENGLKYQEFSNKNTIPGGSTLGNLSNRHVSINMADIGLPQLAMHSANETCGVYDVEDMVKLVNSFFSIDLIIGSNSVSFRK